MTVDLPHKNSVFSDLNRRFGPVYESEMYRGMENDEVDQLVDELIVVLCKRL